MAELRTRVVIGVLAGLALLGLAGFIADGVYATREAQRPLQAALAYCDALRDQRYATAYALLSTALRAQTSEQDFETQQTLHDGVDGPVSVCRLTDGSSAAFTFTPPQSASVSLDLTRAKRPRARGALELAVEHDVWRVTTIPDALQGTDIGPLVTSLRFCRALVARDYPTAYDLLSPAAQQSGSERDFAASFNRSFAQAGGAYGATPLTGCAPDPNSYQVAQQDDAASFALTFETADKVAVPMQVGCVRFDGAWRLDSFSFTPHG